MTCLYATDYGPPDPNFDPLAGGGEAIRGFALAIIFGIIVGTSSSIFIASPILLFLGQKRLRPAIYQQGTAVTAPASSS